MAEGKTIKFSFEVDNASLQKTRKLIAELTNDLKELNKQAATGLGGINATGAAPGTPGGQNQQTQKAIANTPGAAKPLVNTAVNYRQLFTSLSKESKSAMKEMTDAVKDAVKEQVGHLGTLEESIKRIAAGMKGIGVAPGAGVGGAGGAGIGGAGGAGIGGGGPGGRPPGAAPGPAPATPPPPGLGNFIGAMGGGGGLAGGLMGAGGFPGAGGAGPGTLGALMRLGPAWLRGVAGPVGAVMAATQLAANAGNMYRGANDVSLNLRADRNAAMMGGMQALRGGDISYALALQGAARGRGDLGATSLEGVTGLAAKTGRGLDYLGGIGTSFFGGFGTGAGAGTGKAAAAADLRTMDNAAIQDAIGKVELHRAAQSNRFRMALDEMTSEMPMRQAVMGLRGGGGLQVPTYKGPGGTTVLGTATDSFAALRAKSRANQVSMQQMMGGYTSLLSGGRQFAEQFEAPAARAEAAGLSGLAPIMLGLGAAGAGAGNAGMFMSGGINRQSGLDIGQAIIGSGFRPEGFTGGLGVGQAIMGGMPWTGGVQDQALAQRALAGVSTMNRTAGGFDPRQTNVNLLAAMDVGARNVDQQNYVTRLTGEQMADLISGKATPDAVSEAQVMLGPNWKQMLTKYQGKITDAGFNRIGLQAGSPTAKIVAKIQADQKRFGGTLSEATGRMVQAGTLTEGEFGALSGELATATGASKEGIKGQFQLQQGLKIAQGEGLPAETAGFNIPPLLARGSAEERHFNVMGNIEAQLDKEKQEKAPAILAAISSMSSNFDAMATVNKDMTTGVGQLTAALKENTDVLRQIHGIAPPHVAVPGGTD